MKIGKYNYNRCSQKMPCPVCERKKYCLVSDDGNFVICTKMPTAKPYKSYSGWLHSLKNSSYIKPDKVYKTKDYEPNIKIIAEVYDRMNLFPDALSELAEDFHVHPSALSDMGVGKHGNSYGFPMRNAQRKITGIMKRGLNGKKWCIPHSRVGMYIPRSFNPIFETFVFDGASDTTVMAYRKYNAIGRFSESSCVNMIIELLAKCPIVTLVPDNDIHGSGYRYAVALAEKLYRSDRKVNILFNRKHKDTRTWIDSGTFTEEEFTKLKRRYEPTKEKP